MRQGNQNVGWPTKSHTMNSTNNNTTTYQHNTSPTPTAHVDLVQGTHGSNAAVPFLSVRGSC